jgi:RNA polymerase sigma-54 factor
MVDIVFRVGMEVSDQEMRALVHLIQDFEPAGVCARNLQESTLKWAERKYGKR